MLEHMRSQNPRVRNHLIPLASKCERGIKLARTSHRSRGWLQSLPALIREDPEMRAEEIDSVVPLHQWSTLCDIVGVNPQFDAHPCPRSHVEARSGRDVNPWKGSCQCKGLAHFARLKGYAVLQNAVISARSVQGISFTSPPPD